MQPELEAQSPVTREPGKNPLDTMDAKLWAEEWMRLFGGDCNERIDEGLMIGWFANAIMKGYDTARNKYERQSPPLAWDEKRCREFVIKCRNEFVDISAFFAPNTMELTIERLTAELLSSMPGGRVERKGDLTFFLRNVLSQGGAIQQDYANRPYEEYARRLDVASVERADELASILSGRGADDSEEAVKHDGPYIEVPRTVIDRKYNPDYGDKKVCECGHIYSRHFDSYEDMADVGCKYCGCSNFNPMPNPLPGIELNREGK